MLPLDELGLTALVADERALHQLATDVGRWIHDIRTVTELRRDKPADTTVAEITFWADWEKELLRLQARMSDNDIGGWADRGRGAVRPRC